MPLLTAIHAVVALFGSMLRQAMEHVKKHNFRVEAHAIGDRAALHLIDAFEKLFVCDDRPVLTHCQPRGLFK